MAITLSELANIQRKKVTLPSGQLPGTVQLNKLSTPSSNFDLGAVDNYLAGAKNIDPTMLAMSQKLVPSTPADAGLTGNSGAPTPFGSDTYMGAPQGTVPSMEPINPNLSATGDFNTNPIVTHENTDNTSSYSGYGTSESQSGSATTGTTTDGFDPLKAYRDLAMEQAMHSSQGTGLYAMQPGVQYSPDQIMNQRKAADKLYNQALSEYANAADSYISKNKSTTPTYGLDSILSGLSVNGANAVKSASDKFDASPIVRDFNIIQRASGAAENVLKDINSRPDKKATAGDDMSLMYLFAKAQDPNSVVRESEYANVADYFSTLPQAVQFKLSQIYKPAPDGRLTDLARQNIAKGIKTLYSTNKQQYDNLKSETARQIDAVTGKKIGSDYLKSYESAYDTPTDNPDKAALDAGYSQEEIDAYKSKQGFKSVGNTSASIEIPKTSRLSFVNNNPGNLRFAGQAGAVEGEGGFAKFTSPDAGVKALTNQIKLDTGRGHTLASFINKFAPPTENDTNQYIAQAVKNLGVSPETPLSKIPQDKLTKFMALKESSTKIL